MKPKPTATLFFMLSVVGILAILMLIFPKDGVSISKDLTLYFPDWEEWWLESIGKIPTESKVDLPDLVEEDTNNFSDTTTVEDPIQVADMSGIPDFDSSVYKFTPRPIKVESIKQPLELPNEGLKCLENLFQSLINPDELSKVVRILHYGDSQIETDRITNYLRYKFQQQFGGSGPGLIPAKTPYDYKSPCQVINEGEWTRYTVFPKIDTCVKHSRYGALASFARFSPIINNQPKQEIAKNDTLNNDSTIISENNTDNTESVNQDIIEPQNQTTYTASLKFVPTKLGYGNVGVIKRVKMFYGNNTKPFSIKIADGETILYADMLNAEGTYASKTWNFAQTPNDFHIDFSGEDSPDIYAFAMDGLSGVAIDNIALRGCSGTIFTKLDGNFLSKMYRELNVKCVILQFGGNTVPYLTPERVAGFKSSFVSQIKYIKRICPGISIIVVGPADMSTKVQDNYETYEVLPDVVDAMRNAALQNGCAFWDMYSAMGGANTMPDWVFHDPPYAEKDFVHFTPNGASVIAKMFYNALITRYNEYIGKNSSASPQN